MTEKREKTSTLKFLVLKLTWDIPDHLKQGSETHGPPDVFMQPALLSKFLLLFLKLQFYVVLDHFFRPFVARGDIWPPCSAGELFLIKMWPTYIFEFETPDLQLVSKFSFSKKIFYSSLSFTTPTTDVYEDFCNAREVKTF